MTDGLPDPDPTRSPQIVRPPAPAQGSSPGRRRVRDFPRRELRVVGHTVATYEISGDEKRTVAYVRRLFAQRRIPDSATVELGPERIVIEWRD